VFAPSLASCSTDCLLSWMHHQCHRYRNRSFRLIQILYISFMIRLSGGTTIFIGL
jgi:hypothetical protein